MGKQELHIFPCADTLLYLPVYLGIELLKINPKLRFHGEPANNSSHSVIWESESFLVVLHQATEGDNKAILAIEEHQKAHPADSCIAIADPMHTLHDGIKNESLRIVATFINRIALCSVFKEPKHKSGKKADWWNIIQDLQTKIAEYGRPLGGDHEIYKQIKQLKVAFCEAGETNKSLLKYFLDLPKSDVAVQGFGPPEFEVVVNNESAVSFTTAPWLRQACKVLFRLGKDKIHIGHWLPSVPYPFSSVITTQDSWKLEKEAKWKGPIGQLVRHMMMASAMLTRYRGMLAKGLHAAASNFRFFGLPPDCAAEQYTIISDAVYHLVERDYLAEHPENPWVAWDFAADVITPESMKRLSWSGIYTSYAKAVEREKELGFWRTLADDEDFWKNDFRSCMALYLSRYPARDVNVRLYS